MGEVVNKRYINTRGYVMISCKGHPGGNTGGYVSEHIVIIEGMIGRPLFKHEVVHHRNFKRWDNRPENLLVMLRGEYCGLHTTKGTLKEVENEMIFFFDLTCRGLSEDFIEHNLSI